MKSLLQAAESVKELSPVILDEANVIPAASGKSDNIISSEEQQEIVKEIDRLTGQSRINVTPDLFKISAAKTGMLFPLLVNVAAVAILAGGIFATKYYFEVKDQEMLIASAEQQSAEGNLIKEIKKETEQKLAEKESEIRSIQESMDKIESEKASLEQDMNSKISEKEAQLQAEMQAALAAEREKLRSQGMSASQIDEQIARLELEKTSLFDQQIAAYKEEARLEKIQLEDSLNQLQNEYNSKLTNINEERSRIEAEAKSREDELNARMEARTTQLETEKTQARQELQKLTESKEREGLVENQIIGFYKTIESRLKAGEMDAASRELKNLENYLYDDSVVGLEGLSKRREIDLFVIDSLSKLIDATKTDPQAELDTMSLIDAADRLKEIRQTVANADQQLAVGNREMADMMYRNALEKIPEINRSHKFFIDTMEAELEQGYDELNDIQTRFEQLIKDNADRRDSVGKLITEADRTYQSGDYANALQSYKKAIEATGFENMGNAADKMVTSGNNLAIAPFRETINNMTGRVTGLETDKKTLENTLAEKEKELASYSSRLDEFNSQLEGRSGDLATLNQDYEDRLSEIETLREELNNKNTEMLTLNDKISSQQNQVSSLMDELSSQTGEIQTYEQRIEEMRVQLEEEKSRVTTSREESRMIDREMAELTTLKAQLNRLNKSYTDFELIAENLDDSLQGDAAAIEALYKFFEEDSVDEVMPGIGDYLRSFSTVYISAGQEIGLYEAISLLYDLNNMSSTDAKINYLEVKKSEYKNNEAMMEMIDQLKQSIEEGA